jgi:hypothetical protein
MFHVQQNDLRGSYADHTRVDKFARLYYVYPMEIHERCKGREGQRTALWPAVFNCHLHYLPRTSRTFYYLAFCFQTLDYPNNTNSDTRRLNPNKQLNQLSSICEFLPTLVNAPGDKQAL